MIFNLISIATYTQAHINYLCVEYKAAAMDLREWNVSTKYIVSFADISMYNNCISNCTYNVRVSMLSVL